MVESKSVTHMTCIRKLTVRIPISAVDIQIEVFMISCVPPCERRLK